MSTTQARLRRVLVMVPWLLEHHGVHVEEVARRFDTTPEDVMADLDVLGYCGLPGYGGGDLIEATVVGGRVVVRMAEFFSRPLALSIREVTALLLAARATRNSGVLAASHEPLEAAIAVLEAHLGAAAAAPVAVDVTAGGADLLGRLTPAVAAHQVVRITYRSASKEETTTREVEPWALREDEGAWYLHGWCRLAEDSRAFRLDRIRDLEVREEVVRPPADPPVRPARYVPAEGDPEVVVIVPGAQAWAADDLAGVEREATADGRIRLTFRAATLEWAATWVLRIGQGAEVVAPPGLADLVRQRAHAVLSRYGPS